MKAKGTISEEIIVRAIDGDTEAFNYIYQNYYNRVYFIGMQFFRDEEMAKDIVQEVFIKVYRKFKDLKEPKAFYSWIQKITYNQCLHYARKKKIKIIDLGEEMNIEDFEDYKNTPIEITLENKRVKTAILESLETMSIPLKSVGFLRFHEDYQIEEIASILDIPKGTVNSRINKIKKVLRIDLKEKGITVDNYSVLVFTPGLLKAAYDSLIDRYTLSESNSIRIYQNIIESKLIFGIFTVNQLITSIVTTFIVTGTATAFYFSQVDIDEKINFEVPQIVIPEIALPSKRPARIESIQYNSEWTNQPIFLTFTTTSDDYDQILVNDIDSNKIIENGIYTVTLIKDNEIIDQQDLHINNIDVQSPEGGESSKIGDEYTLYLSDNLSQIDSNSILHYKNGILTNDFSYYPSENKLVFMSKPNEREIFYISDYAGNVLEIDIE